jgi:uncharacterized membrane protein YphA (DoxX/SURF4 family)
MTRARVAESVLLQLPLRVVVGGLFCLAAFKKLQDPQSFAEAIKGFKVLDHAEHAHLIVSAAFTIPWVEMLAGVFLILGLWTRASAAAVGLALLMFIAGLLSVLIRGLETSCSCFGDLSLVCPPEVGWCQVIRNLVLLLPAGYLLWRGGGLFALDSTLDRRAARRARLAAVDADADGA